MTARALFVCFGILLALTFFGCGESPPSVATDKMQTDQQAESVETTKEAAESVSSAEPENPTEPPQKTFENPYPKGTLYHEFLEAKHNGKPSRLTDYSYAGYHRSQKPLPTVSKDTYRYFDVTEYGARPGDNRSDRDAVIAALTAAHAHDGPAVVYFPPGNFRLFEKSDFGKVPIEITRSNIVLKGAGMGSTQLEFAETHLPARPLILFRSSTGKDDYWRGDKKLNAVATHQVDTYTVEVSDTSGLKPGMRINFNPSMDPNAESTKEFFAPHDVPQGIFNRAKNKGGVLTDIFELHEIKSIDGNLVTFGEPIQLEFDAYQNFQIYRIDGIIEECGIEDLSLRGGWRGVFQHHNGSRYGEDYIMIAMNRVFNSWVRRVRIADYSFAFKQWLCGFNTITDVILEGNPGHLSMVSQSSYGNLFAFIREQRDTHHGLGVSRSGTNSVFYRCVQHESMEAHCGYPRATLYDLNEGGFHPRGGGATFFPMHDKGLTFWNWNVTKPGSFDFWPEGKRYGYFLRPIIAGLHGEKFEIPDVETDLLAFESPGIKTAPESLFEAQLKQRLGYLPEWLVQARDDFESVSRHSVISIAQPLDQTVHNNDVLVSVELDPDLDPSQVTQIDLHVSKTSRWDGFLNLGEISVESLKRRFRLPTDGVWILKLKLTNSRDEISFSKPITVFVGREQNLREVEVVDFAMIPAKAKNKLYQEFVKMGGGEAAKLPTSKVLLLRDKNEPLHTVEVPYREELHQFYRDYGKKTFNKLLDKDLARPLFDGKSNNGGPNVYGYQDTLIQAKFPFNRRINRLDIHWKDEVPGAKVRLEIQTSQDLDAWNSFANDDRLWEFSVGRLGGTLVKAPLPGSNGVSSIYFPERDARLIRLLLTSFPNEIAELKFYGP